MTAKRKLLQNFGFVLFFFYFRKVKRINLDKMSDVIMYQSFANAQKAALPKKNNYTQFQSNSHVTANHFLAKRKKGREVFNLSKCWRVSKMMQGGFYN